MAVHSVERPLAMRACLPIHLTAALAAKPVRRSDKPVLRHRGRIVPPRLPAFALGHNKPVEAKIYLYPLLVWPVSGQRYAVHHAAEPMIIVDRIVECAAIVPER